MIYSEQIVIQTENNPQTCSRYIKKMIASIKNRVYTYVVIKDRLFGLLYHLAFRINSLSPFPTKVSEHNILELRGTYVQLPS